MQKKLFLTLALMLSLCKLYAKEKSSHIQPPPLKIGYTSVEYILGFLPETKAIKSEYTSLEKQLKNQLEARVGDFQQKVQAFQQGYEAMTEAVRNQKQLELQKLQGSLEQLQLESQEKLTSKQTNLLKPVYEKITNTIAQVAKENGYTHVLDNNVGGIPILLYADAEHDISDLVLKKLGIDPDKPEGKKK
ncbi:MAG TPA: outer membrane chaperone Skp [Amoebophilaceae bacterium]|nr:outer membrane chaperone Skp [Amoebophilaceae bacterium]